MTNNVIENRVAGFENCSLASGHPGTIPELRITTNVSPRHLDSRIDRLTGPGPCLGSCLSTAHAFRNLSGQRVPRQQSLWDRGKKMGEVVNL